MVLPTSGDTDAAAARKIWKLETRDSLVKLQENLLSPDAVSRTREELHEQEPLALRVAIKRGRLVLLAAVAVTMVVVLLLTFSGGVVIETFERRAVSIQKQEKLVEKYNSYSGTVTAAIERPLELFMALVVHVAVLRLMANDVLDTEKQWRVRVVVVALSAGATYLLVNGLSAVNVQTREQPVRLAITTNDLAAQTPDLTTTSTVDKSLAENRSGNPVTNTILRNLLLPQAIETEQACSDLHTMLGEDEVLYRITPQAWQQHLLPTALEPRSMQFEVAASNTAANIALTTGEFPMNASLAAELLLYSSMDPSEGSAWGSRVGLVHRELAQELYLEHNQSVPMAPYATFDVPTTRCTPLLPPSLATTEREDREWFLKHAVPTMYNYSSPDYTNASLRSWNMAFSHVDIEPGTLWVDAVTVEREMATPRLATNATNGSSTRYFAIDATIRGETVHTASKFILKAGGAVDEGIELYSVCADYSGVERIASGIDHTFYTSAACNKRSETSLLVVSRGRRLVADTLIENATIESSELVLGTGDGVIVNMREISSVTVARISWRLQNLSSIYNAKCDDIGGCMGLDVALPGSGQRLLVSASALPLAAASPMLGKQNQQFNSLALVSVRRPEHFYVTTFDANEEKAEYIGDVLMPHNIGTRNASQLAGQEQASGQCLSKREKRLARYINNHIYMEMGSCETSSNQSWTTQRMLAFDGNKQDVNVVVFIPRLNVILTLVGCVVLVAVVALVLLWPLLGKKESDPLARITTPHSIASVLVNERSFPPLLLTRSVAPSEGTVCRDNADEFTLKSLSLGRKETQDDGENDVVVNDDAGHPKQRIDIDP